MTNMAGSHARDSAVHEAVVPGASQGLGTRRETECMRGERWGVPVQVQANGIKPGFDSVVQANGDKNSVVQAHV